VLLPLLFPSPCRKGTSSTLPPLLWTYCRCLFWITAHDHHYHYPTHHHHHHSLLLIIKLKQSFIFIDIDIDFNFVIVSDLLLTFFLNGPFAPCCFSSSFSSSFLLDSTSASGSCTDVSLEWRYLRQQQLLLPPPMSLFVSVFLAAVLLLCISLWRLPLHHFAGLVQYYPHGGTSIKISPSSSFVCR